MTTGALGPSPDWRTFASGGGRGSTSRILGMLQVGLRQGNLTDLGTISDTDPGGSGLTSHPRRARAGATERRPYVVAHVAVSLDGYTTGFEVDHGRFYTLLPTWQGDITLTGADTILAQERELAAAHRPGPTDGAPLLAVVDSRRRVRQWEALRDCGYWSNVLPLRSASRAPAGDPPIPELVAGSDRVDLRQSLTELTSRTGARVVRVDRGGQLTRALLDLCLVDELSLLVHPCLTDAGSHRWYGSDPPPALTLTRLGVETFDPGLVWLRYRVEQTGPDPILALE